MRMIRDQEHALILVIVVLATLRCAVSFMPCLNLSVPSTMSRQMLSSLKMRNAARVLLVGKGCTLREEDEDDDEEDNGARSRRVCEAQSTIVHRACDADALAGLLGCVSVWGVRLETKPIDAGGERLIATVPC